MSWVYLELALVSLAAMLSPTTLTFSVLALVLASAPAYRRLVLSRRFRGHDRDRHPRSVRPRRHCRTVADGDRKTWVSVFDLVAGAVLLVYVARTWRVPISDKSTKGMVEKMSSVASSPWIAVFAAGATLANPGGFIPLALKAISETNPSAAGYAAEWLAFTLVSLLPLGVAVVLLLVSPDWAERLLHASRTWLEEHLRLIASVIILLLGLSLLRNGIPGSLAEHESRRHVASPDKDEEAGPAPT